MGVSFDTEKGKMIDKISALLAVILSIVALGLVAGWASENGHYPNGPDYSWLTKPNWGGNEKARLAWHPVLMVAGFFVCQIQALIVWTADPSAASTLRKVFLWFFRLAALSCFIAAMCAVVNFKLYTKQDALISLHSWIGVCAFVVFGLSFCWGFVADFVSSIAKGWEVKYDVDYLHKFLSIVAVVLSATAIVSGIVQYTVANFGVDETTGERKMFYMCSFLTDAKDSNNPAYYYDHLPNSCKAAYGCGLAVVGAAAFALIAITYSMSFNPQSYKEVRNQE